MTPHSNEIYGLTPNLYRSSPTVDGFFAREQVLIEEAIRLQPEDFKGLTSFQILSKLQHYGLPTRLLDTTTNPLVALYFATDGPSNVDGEVLVLPRIPVLSEDAAPVTWLSNWALRGKWGRTSADEIAEAAGYDHGDDAATQYQSLKEALSQPFLGIRPRYSNDRLRAQNGAFLLTGMEIDGFSPPSTKPSSQQSDEFLVRPMRFLERELGKSSTSHINQPRLLINGEAKMKIRRQLDYLGVNAATLFPDTASRMWGCPQIVDT